MYFHLPTGLAYLATLYQLIRMPVYKFKVKMEDDEDVFRIIEIRPAQTFHELKETFLKSIDFDNIHDSSFYVSDDLWRQGREIAGNERKDKAGNALPLQEKTKINSMVNDPHQKFVFIYDLDVEWTFLIELTGISRDESEGTAYPKVIKTVGKAPKQYRATQKIGSELDDDEFAYLTTKLLAREELDNNIEMVGEEDAAAIEGEEGEEEEKGEDSDNDSDEMSEDSDEGMQDYGDDHDI